MNAEFLAKSAARERRKDQDMKFFLPTKAYEEKNCVINHAAELAALGKKALVVTGRSSAVKCGAQADVEAALSKCGVSWVTFNKVEENPSVTTVMEGAKLGMAEGCDFVIGIGGGSPMDAAKAMALMMKHPQWGIGMLFTAGQDNSAVPMAMIPTTCGTGSEVTPASVLTDHEAGKKGGIPYKLFADLALIDSTYLGKAPLSVLRNTAVDALSHLIESYCNALADDYSRMFVREGLRFWAMNKAALKGEKEITAEDLETLAHASVLGGMAIAHTSTSLPHGLSYTLTFDMGIPHGVACGRFQKGFLDAAPEEDRKEVLALLGFESTDELWDMYVKICEVIDIPAEILEKAVDSAVKGGRLATAGFELTPEGARTVAGL